MQSNFQEVRIGGELSYYLVNLATQTVFQVKTNRMTGRVFKTDISKTKKAEQVKGMAGH